VLDANALIGFFEGRRGVSEKVSRLLSDALRQDSPLLMSAVNWGEVFYMEWRYQGEAKAREAEAILQRMPVAVIAVDRERESGGDCRFIHCPGMRSRADFSHDSQVPCAVLVCCLASSDIG
jgi:uncharacterized protein with PIN domain